MFQSLDLLVLSCLFSTFQTQTGRISEPQNVSLSWISDFEPQLSWTPPQHSMKDCEYEVAWSTSHNEIHIRAENVSDPLWSDYVVMKGGFLHLSVTTVCGHAHSEQVVIDKSYAELVRNVECYIHSSKHTKCSWTPISHATDLSFFYELVPEDLSTSSNDDSSSVLKECSSYIHSLNGVRIGCDLQANINHDVHILFNGTVNNTLARNTFKKELKRNVRPPPLKWTVKKNGDKFNINWIPPDIAGVSHWTFNIRYTVCNEEQVKNVFGETSTELDVVPHCPYSMAIKAHAKGGGTPWSEEKHFDADTDPNAPVYAAIIIPLTFAGLAVLTFVCCRKNKDTIFPKAPVPRDLLSDISDNGNKSTGNLYIPAEEEDICKITLVIDSQNNELYF